MKKTKMWHGVLIAGCVVVIGCAAVFEFFIQNRISASLKGGEEAMSDLRRSVNYLQQDVENAKELIPNKFLLSTSSGLRRLYFSGQLTESESMYPDSSKDVFIRFLGIPLSHERVGILVGGKWSQNEGRGVRFFPYDFHDKDNESYGSVEFIGMSGTSTAVFRIPEPGGDPSGGTLWHFEGLNLITGNILDAISDYGTDFRSEADRGIGTWSQSIMFGAKESLSAFYDDPAKWDGYRIVFRNTLVATGSQMYTTVVTQEKADASTELLRLTHKKNTSPVIDPSTVYQGLFQTPVSIVANIGGKSYTFIAKDGKITLMK